MELCYSPLQVASAVVLMEFQVGLSIVYSIVQPAIVGLQNLSLIQQSYKN